MTKLKGSKFRTTLTLEFKGTESGDKTKHSTQVCPQRLKIIFNEIDFDDVFESIFSRNKLNIQKSLGKGLGWIIDSVVDSTMNIFNNKSLSSSSYVKLPKQLDHPRKF